MYLLKRNFVSTMEWKYFLISVSGEGGKKTSWEPWSTTEQPMSSPTQLWPRGNVGFEFGALPIFQMNLGIGIFDLTSHDF